MTYKLYGRKIDKKFFIKSTKGQFIKSGMKTDTVDRGIIAMEKNGTGYGVFNSDGKFVKSSIQLRHTKGQFIPKINVKKDKFPYFDFDVIYMGDLEEHFGHFMLEHLNRAYVLLDPKYKNCKCVYVNAKKYDKAEIFVYEFMQLLGIDPKNVIILQESAQFKSVIVPEQSFNIPVFSSTEFRDTFQYLADKVDAVAGCEKIYVSRGALTKRRTFNEEQIENIFQKNGYKVISPEMLPLAQQIGIFKNCKSLAGLAGTALHHVLFMPAGGEVIQIKRNTVDVDNSYNQYLLNNTKHVDFVLIAGSIEKYRTEHFTELPQIVGITEHMKKFLDDRDFVYTDVDIAWNQKSWDDYTQALNEYLAAGHTEVGDKIKRKIVKLTSCVIPGRRNRNAFRNWLKEILGC